MTLNRVKVKEVFIKALADMKPNEYKKMAYPACRACGGTGDRGSRPCTCVMLALRQGVVDELSEAA